jgi:hypothetical protein
MDGVRRSMRDGVRSRAAYSGNILRGRFVLVKKNLHVVNGGEHEHAAGTDETQAEEGFQNDDEDLNNRIHDRDLSEALVPFDKVSGKDGVRKL